MYRANVKESVKTMRSMLGLAHGLGGN